MRFVGHKFEFSILFTCHKYYSFEFFQPFKNLPDARLDLAVGYHLPNPDVDDADKILSMVQSTHPKVAALLTVMTPDLSPTLASLVLPL